MTQFDPIAPSEILAEEFLRSLGLSQNKLARDLDVPVAHINHIIHGKRGISADTALRLAAHFKPSPEFWLNLQTRHDLKLAEMKTGDAIACAIRPFEPAAMVVVGTGTIQPVAGSA
jgi:antitoxin HigA-1